MRALLVLVLGALLGAGAMLAYFVFAGTPIAGPDEPLPKHPPITLALGVPFLQQVVERAAEEAPDVGLSSKDIKVSLRDRDIVVTAPVTLVGKPTRASIILRPAIERGTLKFDVVGSNLGGMPVPKIGELVDKEIDARIRALMNGLPIVVTGAKVDKKRGLVVTGSIDLAKLEAALGR